MKRISLQWRITLLTAGLIAVTCVVMNFLLYGSGLYYMDTIVGIFEPKDNTEFSFEISEDDLAFQPLPPDSEKVPIVITTVQERYRIASWCITVAITLLSSVIAYFVTGRALRPLRGFVTQTEAVQLSNLSDVRFDAKTIPEFEALSQAFNEMMNRLEQGFATQRQFAGNAAHELRTPLALMQAKLELFRQENPHVLPETDAFLTELQEQLERLTRLSKTLLEMSDLQSVPRTKHIHMAPLIEEVFMDLSPLAEKQEISLCYHGDAALECSDTLLYRLLFNLTENAIRYNHPGGRVTVSVLEKGTIPLADNQFALEVANTGTPIPKEYYDSIFEPFFRIDKSRSRALGGAGLGLPMVRKIARLHGGDAWVKESSEAGTVFLVTLSTQSE